MDAAGYGQLHILKFLRKEGCPWDYRTCFWAAKKGRADILQWAIDNGCPEPMEDEDDSDHDCDEYIELKMNFLMKGKKADLIDKLLFLYVTVFYKRIYLMSRHVERIFESRHEKGTTLF